MINLERGRHEKVLKDLRKGLQLNETSSSVLEGLAFAHNFFKDYDSSIYYARKIIEVDTLEPAGYFWLAKSYFMTGNIDSARFYADQCADYAASDTVIAAGLRVLQEQIERQYK
jgi:tetratricopeptide (TPR) repeat protein